MKISNPSSSGLLPPPPKPLVSSPLYEPTSVLDPHLTSSPSAGLLFPDDPLSFLLSDLDPPSPDPLIDLLLRAAHSLQFPDHLNSSLSLLSLLLLLLSSHKSLSDLSPIPHFSSLTSNQTLLESLLPSPSLHLIDFRFSHAAHWSSFASDLHLSLSLPPPSLRITAVLPFQSPLTSLAADNLRDFALSLSLPLTLHFLLLHDISAIQLRDNDSVGVVLTPNHVSRLPVMRFLRRVAPRVVLVVDDGEGGCGSGGSFGQRFAAGLEYFAAVMEAVEIGAGRVGAGEEVVRRIEEAVMRPRIFEAVAGAAEGAGDWREIMREMGMVERELSRFTESQAECLLRRGPAVEGFRVERKDRGGLVLTWKGKELAATSAWRFP